jgi:hypothetical protein
MPAPLYTQTVIAFVWDFDRTLIPSNMQDPIFAEYGVEPSAFWTEVDGLTEFYARSSRISSPMCGKGSLPTFRTRSCSS